MRLIQRIPEPALLPCLEIALLLGELVERWDLVRPLVGELLHFELKVVALRKFSLRNDVVFLVMQLFFWVLNRWLFLELATRLRLNAEIGVGFGAGLRDSGGSLLILGKLPHRVLAHALVFE